MSTLPLRLVLCAMALGSIGCAAWREKKCCDDPFLGEDHAVHRGNNADERDLVLGQARYEPTMSDRARAIGASLREDAVGVYGDPWNLALLGTALGGAIAVRQDLDDQVREDAARHPHRWGEATTVIGRFGEAPVQIPALLGLHSYSVLRENHELRAFGDSAISAYTLTGLSTVAVKGIANTERPTDEWNGGQWGFPSFHAASGFTLAAVVDEHYGTTASIPAYAAAGLISWTRIDDRDHDLSDVLFGAALGFVIGKSVARRRLHGDSRVRVAPWLHSTENATGLLWAVDY